MKSQDVAHAWANQQSGGEASSNMYFAGRTIYSYGSHFPMATIDEKDQHIVWFTTRTRSNTTAKHLSWTRSAASHKTLIRVSEVPSPENRINPYKDKDWQKRELNGWTIEIRGISAQIKGARKPEKYLDQIADVINEMKEFIALVGYKVDKKLQAILDDPSGGLALKYEKDEADKMERRRKADKKKAEARVRPALQEWKSGKTNATHEFDRVLMNTYLRVRGCYVVGDEDNGVTFIETSKGKSIPLHVAHIYWKIVQDVLAGKQKLDDCGVRFLDICVNEITTQHLLVGCHDILMQEIEDIAQLVGWKVD